MDFWSETSETVAKWILQGLEGFWPWCEAVARWMLQTLQGLWPFAVDAFNIVIKNPEPVAIGLATGVFIIAFGLVGGRAWIGHIDRKSSSKDEDLDDNDDDDAFEVDSEDESLRDLSGIHSRFGSR